MIWGNQPPIDVKSGNKVLYDDYLITSKILVADLGPLTYYSSLQKL